MLDSVHFDIQLAVIQLLEPMDVVAIGQTCRCLYDATFDRKLWTSALRKMCALNGLYLPTFPVNEMTVQQLRDATLTPDKTVSILFKESPIFWNTINENYWNKSTKLRSTFLVPGGRFLITQDEDGLGVWDLSVPLYDSGLVGWQPLPVQCPLMKVAPSTEFEACRMVMIGEWKEAEDESDPTQEIRVYEFSGASMPTGFNLFSVPLDFHTDFIDLTSIKGNMIALLNLVDRKVYVCNFVNATWACWGVSSTEDEYQQLSLDDNFLCLLTEVSLEGYLLPAFEPCRESGTLSFPERDPTFLISTTHLLAPESDDTTIIHQGSSWYCPFALNAYWPLNDIGGYNLFTSNVRVVTSESGIQCRVHPMSSVNFGYQDIIYHGALEKRPLNSLSVNCWWTPHTGRPVMWLIIEHGGRHPESAALPVSCYLKLRRQFTFPGSAISSFDLFSGRVCLTEFNNGRTRLAIVEFPLQIASEFRKGESKVLTDDSTEDLDLEDIEDELFDDV